MFTVSTSEIRWFYDGEIPDEICNWIQNLKGEIESQPPRTDVYLNINDTPNLGIKFREGRFEVKQKMKKLGEFTSNNISGKAELWKKWSFVAEDGKIPLADIQNGEWVEITKSRKLKKYIISETGEIKEGFDNYQSDGCNLELTKIICKMKSFWTLGLETYGQTNSLHHNLKTAFEFVFQSKFPIKLNPSDSFSYPEWIIKAF